MNELEEPARLLDDTSEPGGLRDVLRSARSDVGTDAEVARLAARLGPLLGPPIPPPHAGGGAAPGAAGSGLAGSAKLALGALALVAAGGAWWLSGSAPPPENARGSAAPIVQPPPVVVVPPVAGPAASGAAESPAAPVDAPPTSEPAVRPLPAKPTPPQAPSEAELLEQARSSLKSDPARALTRANEHRARFPRGVLVQEREVIAIQALRQLGRGVEADRRAEAFAKAFPGSAFQRKLKPSP